MGRKRVQRGFAAVAAVLIGGAIGLSGSIGGAQAATVTKYVFNPSPIGKNLPNNTQVTVTVTADSGTTPVPNVAVYLSFVQASGGGTAFVGPTALRTRPASFLTGSTGQVSITYTTPATKPTAGGDELRAFNASTSGASTVKATDLYVFGAIASMAVQPRPIARAGTLTSGQTAAVTLTAFDVNGARSVNANVYLSFKPATGGGTASVNGVALTITPAAFKTDVNGQITITYKAPATIPHTGVTDKILAAVSPSHSPVSVDDTYTYR